MKLTEIKESTQPPAWIFHTLVVQNCNLLWRRIAFCASPTVRTRWHVSTLCRLQIGDTAECNSALRSALRFLPPLERRGLEKARAQQSGLDYLQLTLGDGRFEIGQREIDSG
jgi:hypothetical protein